jgi:asparagine synthase (glutamine-hydrolysing)
MCGIAGIIDKTGISNDFLLQRMRDALIHRGPDAGGQISWKTPSYLGLAHRRLAILDTSEQGHQPMHFNAWSIVFNGEIYNFKQLKNELLALGHSFNTQTDTEVILHAFDAWGIEAIQRFKGMFALALVNHTTRELFLFRDRFGVKPLYFFVTSSCFLFASELKAFQAHPSFTTEISLPALAQFLLYGNVPAPNAIFKDTFKLSPGSMLRLNVDNLTLDIQSFWSPISCFASPTKELSLMDAKHTIKPLLEDSVMQRTVSDVPIGLFLSGGYDSATTAGILAQSTDSLKTFTVSVPDAGLNEGPKAREIARYLGTDHTEIECSVEEVLKVIPMLPVIYDEPFADSSAIPTYLVAQEAIKSVKVALSADGGDELFGGYNRYSYFLKIPQAVKYLPPLVGMAAEQTIHLLKLEGIKAQRMVKFSRLFQNFSLEKYMKAMTESLAEHQLRPFLRQDVAMEYPPFARASSPLATLMLNDALHYLPNDILHKVDRATMAVGLEGREPFLDHQLYAAVAALPDSLKCTKNNTKILLKEIAHDYVPASILAGPKKGFAIPINAWMRTFLANDLRDVSSFEFLERQALFNAEPLQREVNRFLKGNESKALFIWYFYCFQSWYKQWMMPAK